MESPQRRKATFIPQAFDVTSVEQALAVALIGEPGITSAERHAKETPYLVGDIGAFLPITPTSCVLDFGCGVGRIAKELIEKFGCRVVGVDFSPSMRLLATEYVESERFAVWSPEILEKMIADGFRTDFCVCIWVIQHVLSPAEVLDQIDRSLRPGGLLYTLNQKDRCVPTDLGWIPDGFDVQAALRQKFHEENAHPLPLTAASPGLSAISTIQVLRKRG